MKRIMTVVCAASFGMAMLILAAAAIGEYRKISLDEGMAAVTETMTVKETQKQTDNRQETASPAAQESPTVVLELMREAEVLLAGDICLQQFITNYYDKDGILGITTAELRDMMLDADIMMANQEFPFSDRGTPMENKQFTFRTAPHYVDIFTDLGIDMVSLANNHTLDYGRTALEDSFPVLDNANIRYVGAGENLERAKQLEIIGVNGIKIGFLAASRVIPVADWNAGTELSGMFTTYDPTALIEEIEKGKRQCDALIVYVHWGEEKTAYPVEYQKTMAYQYIDAGADAVIGAHPHVMQGIEYYKGKIIAYSLGNYIFGTGTGNTAMLRLTFQGDGTQEAQLVAVDASAFPVAVMQEGKRGDFFRYMEGISYGITIDEEGRICYTEDER